jgi:hypothetical protein
MIIMGGKSAPAPQPAPAAPQPTFSTVANVAKEPAINARVRRPEGETGGASLLATGGAGKEAVDPMGSRGPTSSMLS